MADPRILLNNTHDIYALGYVSIIPGINEKKTFQKDKLITNTYSLVVENYDNFFSVNNPVSLLNSTNWLYMPVTIYNSQNEIVWDGEITSIERNHNTKTVILKSKNSLFKHRNTLVTYESSTWETPADAFKNVCASIGFTNYNNSAATTSADNYTLESCYIKCNFNPSDDITFQRCIEKLGVYGNADVYSHNNEIYFVHWIPYVGGSITLLNATEKNKFRTLPRVVESEGILVNDYEIGYDGDLGVPITDATQNNIGNISRTRWQVHSLPEMRSDDNAQIKFKDSTSALIIGEGYIKRSHKNLTTQPYPLTAIKFNLFADNREWLTLQSFFGLTLPDEGWTDKVFEVFEFTINEENDDIEIFAYEAV